ncbi:MAG: response regulator [Bacilli bacterium]|nr:response regulator [Bacilli bacterium]
MISVIFNINGFIYVTLMVIVFFSKQRLRNTENSLFAAMLITSLIGCLLDSLSGLLYLNGYDMSNIFYIIIVKLIFAYYMVWDTEMFYYVVSISNLKLDDNKIKKATIFTAILLLLLVVILPFSISSVGDTVRPVGAAVDMIFFVSILLAITIMTVLIICRKNIKSKKYLPLFIYLFLSLIIFIIQNITGLLLMTSVLTFVNVLMYFTIENPDLQMIEQLNEAKSQAEKANHAKTDFLSSMSHEIRTPLNAIVGFSQALSEENLPESAMTEVKDIMDASETLLDIVNSILDISKIEANKLEIIDKEYSFRKIYDELVALTKARLGEKPLDLRFHYDDTIPEVLYGDKVRVKQVILNLLTNSIKYTKEGFVDFTVRSVIKDDMCRLIISVEDSGIGIKKENIEKLFTKFERFDEKNTTIEGTGLGLAITKRLINLMNGQIIVHSVFGEGSKFTIVIDQKIIATKATSEIEKTSTIDFVIVDATGKRILVVDDNKLNLKVASRLLETYKAEIITVESGFAALDKIGNGEKYDLILLDDMMPRMSGTETLQKLKALAGFNTPTVALTANAIEGMKEKYLNDGFDDYLSKPIDKMELNRVISKYLNK